jgi:hypothetical protein
VPDEKLPLDYLQGQKDGLEWAAQMAEANHPETGDWLYDDPVELAKAIRKGPDMPAASDGWIPVSERMPLTPSADCKYSDVEVCAFDGDRVLTAHYAIGSHPHPWGDWVDTTANITHWQPLPDAPKGCEVENNAFNKMMARALLLSWERRNGPCKMS